MTRCLIIKTSSLGDVIHTLPALSEAKKNDPQLIFDWVVENSFKEIPTGHKDVDRVIPIALRSWKKNIFSSQTAYEIKIFLKQLRQYKYDYIIDAQGLIKSSLITKFAKGTKYGFDRESARESLASFFYSKKIKVSKNQHAILRLKQLFANIFNYQTDLSYIHYGLHNHWINRQSQPKKAVFLHATTWATKHWNIQYWQALAKGLVKHDIEILLPWGNEKEKEQAKLIAQKSPKINILNKMNLTELTKLFANVDIIIAVDTGLSHLAAAVGVPVITVYGATSALLTGTLGQSQLHLQANLNCAPCLKKQCMISKEKYSPCQNSIKPDKILNLALEMINN